MRLASLVIAATIFVSSFLARGNSIAGGTAEQVCDVGADYSLSVEDYSEATRRHIQFLSKHPDNAIAHYHLGFALGMLGNRMTEVSEYQRAAALGLISWDLFLNLGLAQLENGDLEAATYSLRRAVRFGESHAESHFSLALVDERRGMLADAEHETLEALRLNPDQPEARNQLGVIYAREGKTAPASLIWRNLLRDLPDYEPARTNLVALGSRVPDADPDNERAAVALPPAATLKTIGDESERRLP